MPHRLCLGALFLLVLGGAAHAAPWDGPAFAADPGEIARAGAALSADGDVLILLDEIQYTLQSDGRVAYRFHRLFKPLTPAGARSWTNLESGWAPWHEARPVIRVRTIARDGKVAVLDPKTVAEMPSREGTNDQLTDTRSLVAPLPAVEIGSIIEEEVVVDETQPQLPGGAIRRLGLASHTPTLRRRVIIDAPASLPVRYKVSGMSLKPNRSAQAGRVILRFETDQPPRLPDPEAFAPVEELTGPMLHWSSGSSWREVARSYGAIVDKQLAGADLKSLTSGVTGTHTAIAAQLLARLHKAVRYTGVEFAEASVVPRTPAETLARGFGDCKDQAALLVGMLRAAGVPAHVALLSTGPGIDLEPDMPGSGAFDHAIVYVPDRPAFWIDPTAELARVGELPTGDQERSALIASEASSALVRTPAAPLGENRIVEQREFFLSERGSARVVETSTYGGTLEREIRGEYQQTERKKIDERLLSYVHDTYRSNKLSKVDFSEPADVQRPFQIRLQMDDAGRGTTDQSDAMAGIGVRWAWSNLPAELSPETAGEHKPRVHPYVHPRLYAYEVHYLIHPPPGFAPKPLPPNDSIPLGPARLLRRFSLDKASLIHVDLSLELGKRRLTPPEFEALRQGMLALQKRPILLVGYEQIGEAHLKAGRVRQGITALRELVALHPKEALHHAQIARALVRGGVADAALEEARKAVAIDPSSPLAYDALGWVLQHDSIGRLRQSNWDRKGSITAYRMAKRLDPTDTQIRGDLAILLEYDAAGVRYSTRSDLADAITEYRAIIKDTGEHQYDDHLLLALIWAGRYREAKELVRTLDATDVRRELLVVAIAATDGASAALREADQFGDPTLRSKAIEGAVSSLVQLRLYAPAAELLSATATGSATPATSQSRAELLRKARRHEELKLDDKDPLTVVKRMLVATLTPALGVAGVRELMSRSGRPEFDDPEARKAFENTQRIIAKRFGKMQLTPPIVADLAFVSLDAKKEGDEKDGYRVVMGTPNGPQVAYVVREDGKWKILALGLTTVALGREALRRATAGQLPSARKLLDWARDDAGGVEDPVANPFSSLWHRGDAGDTEAVQRAAASLLVGTADSTRALAQLEPCRKSGAEPAHSACVAASAIALQHEHRDAEALRMLDELARAHPDSITVFGQRIRTMFALASWSDARKLAEARVQRFPDDIEARRVLADAVMNLGDFKAATAQLGALASSARATPLDLNQLAWASLFSPVTDRDPVELARRAVEQTRGEHAPPMHTLATLLAERGRLEEARETLLASFDAAGTELPEPHDWYVLGVIAEGYGARDSALAAYRKVTPPPGSKRATATNVLAERRINALK